MAGFLIFALIIFLVGSISGVYALYHLSYLCLGVCGAVYWLQKQGRKNIKVSRVMSEERIFCGEEVKVTLKIKNEGNWPIFWLSYDETVPVRLHSTAARQGVSSLRAGEELVVEYILKGNRRGFYPLGPLQIRFGDGFGLAEKVMNFPEGGYLIVYPRLLSLDELGLASRIVFGDILWPQRIYHDPLRFRGLKEYEPGDSVKDIYWPASAAAGALMVKEYDSTVTVENMIFLNLNLKDYKLKGLEPRIELAVEAAASIAQFLIKQGQSVGLVSNGVDPLTQLKSVQAGKGMGHLMKILEMLALLEMAEDAPFLPVVDAGRGRLTPGSTVLLITAADPVELIEFCLDLCRSGLNVVIFIVGDHVLHHEYLQRQYTANLVIYSLTRKEDLYAWQ